MVVTGSPFLRQSHPAESLLVHVRLPGPVKDSWLLVPITVVVPPPSVVVVGEQMPADQESPGSG
jgi:hypothetical protein